MDKKKFNILFKNFAVPVSELAVAYKNSALTIDNGLNSNKVSHCFDNLVEALNEQLNNYR